MGEPADIEGLQLNAVRLALNFMKSDESETQKVRERMKVISRIVNPKKAGFGFVVAKMIKRYNARPFLARTSTRFYHEPGLYFGVDVDLGLWGYTARKGLDSVWDQIGEAIYDVAFVIEGRDDHELPEQMLTCCRMSKFPLSQMARDPPDDLIERYRETLQRELEESQKETAQSPKTPKTPKSSK